MKGKLTSLLLAGLCILTLTGCWESVPNQEALDQQAVAQQQAQYAAAQPIPAFNWSMERHLVTQLYQIRNQQAATHSVWRSDRGVIEGDCPSIGFGIPYDTSLTNPLQVTRYSGIGGTHLHYDVVEQAEPNGVFASKNTAATWVLCASDGGKIEPIYVETKVTTYPYPVAVNYDKNRVTKAGKATLVITAHKE